MILRTAASARSWRARALASLPEVITAAAVLVPIVLHAGSPSLVLTVRASHLRSHAGQISFPGGRLEPTDADLAAAALRETAEEIGIDVSRIEPLGYLSDQSCRAATASRRWWRCCGPDSPLTPDGTEVADVFELPLAFALAAGNYRSRPGRTRGLSIRDLGADLRPSATSGGRRQASWRICASVLAGDDN